MGRWEGWVGKEGLGIVIIVAYRYGTSGVMMGCLARWQTRQLAS